MHARRSLQGYAALGLRSDVQDGVGQLGAILRAQGKADEAAALRASYYLADLEEAAERTLGAEHPHTLASVNNLALLLQDQGQLEEAAPLFRRDLEASERTLGAEHPDTLVSMYNLAAMLEKTGDLA